MLLGTGCRGRTVLALADRVLDEIDRGNLLLTPQRLSQIPGVGIAKACAFLSAMEFARRRIKPRGTKVSAPADVYPLIRHFADRKQETFISVSLNGAHEVIATRVVTIGLLNRTQVHPREVFADPLGDRAASIIIAHNHPSGVLTPSPEDERITQLLFDAGRLLGIQLLDHLIFSDESFLSMKETGYVLGAS